MIRTIIWHIPASLVNCLVADLLLMTCLAHRYIYLKFEIDDPVAPLISLILTVLFYTLNFFKCLVLIISMRFLTMFVKQYYLHTLLLHK